MTNIAITKQNDRNRYYATIDSIDGEAYIDYTNVADDVISANHTWADPALRGSGIARALVNFMIEDSRENHFKIIPACSYIAFLYQRNPKWSDVIVAFN